MLASGGTLEDVRRRATGQPSDAHGCESDPMNSCDTAMPHMSVLESRQVLASDRQTPVGACIERAGADGGDLAGSGQPEKRLQGGRRPVP